MGIYLMLREVLGDVIALASENVDDASREITRVENLEELLHLFEFIGMCRCGAPLTNVRHRKLQIVIEPQNSLTLFLVWYDVTFCMPCRTPHTSGKGLKGRPIPMC